MKTLFFIISVAAVLLLLLVVFLLPFLLPQPVYDVLYGWRYPKTWKVGDGVIKDLGPNAAHHRYTIELADLNAPESTTVKLEMTSLPKVEFAIGFKIEQAPRAGTILNAKPVSAMTHLRVVNEDGEVVIDEKSPLSEWVWSGGVFGPFNAFVYRAGKERRIPLNDGVTRIDRESIKADEGWGTYFTPRKKGRYTVQLELEEPDPGFEPSEFRLVAYGEGWK